MPAKKIKEIFIRYFYGIDDFCFAWHETDFHKKIIKVHIPKLNLHWSFLGIATAFEPYFRFNSKAFFEIQ